jgi:hypothetical protein
MAMMLMDVSSESENFVFMTAAHKNFFPCLPASFFLSFVPQTTAHYRIPVREKGCEREREKLYQEDVSRQVNSFLLPSRIGRRFVEWVKK